MRARASRWRWLVSVCGVALLEGRARAATPLGEFQVNSFFTGAQQFPAVASTAGGAFVVVWESRGQDGSLGGVFGQRFDSAGAKLAAEFQINTLTAGDQAYAKVAAEGDGDFVVVWNSRGAPSDVVGQRFSSSGTKLGEPFQVNSFSNGSQGAAAVAVDADGDFVVVWTGEGNQDGSVSGIFGQRFDSAGARVGGEFKINSFTIRTQRRAAVAMRTSGDFVVVWDSNHEDQNVFAVRAQRFDATTQKVGVEFGVTQAGHASAVAMDANGDFAVVWTSYPAYPNVADVFGRRYDSSGVSLGAPFLVNNHTVWAQFLPLTVSAPGAVAMEADGDFVVAWTSDAQDSFSLGVFGQRFDSAGVRVGVEFQVSSDVALAQAGPVPAIGANGGFMVAWTSDGQDGSGNGVFAQRFGPVAGGATLDVDANDSVEPLTDGLLVVRRLFDFSSASLTTGATGSGCSRCDATAIAAYIDSLGPALDVDGNDAVQPLTDGLMILRRLFGQSSSPLTDGVLGAGCMRCDAGAIAAYIDALKP